MSLRRAGAALVAVLLLGLAFWVGRSNAPTARTGAVATPATSAGAGAARIQDGVPVGYTRSQAGAIAAATNYTQALSGQLLLQPDQYRAAILAVAAPEAKDKLR
ncbi:MAG: hypothetical protein QOJ33_1711, partial [Chloroflexota bacterium]|nr:hypothetical protein [Chloroflexota bacterium]